MTPRSAAVPFAACALIAIVWLNQSVGLAEWNTLKVEISAAPRDHVVDFVRYPFLFLYRRAPDEAMYFATARAILGRSFDQAALDRGGVPESFTRVPSLSDGRWHAPYAEIPLEYPPTAVPFIVLPALVAPTFTWYARLFGALMGACLVASIAIAIRTAGRARTTDGSSRASWWLACLLLLAHGAIAIQRLDAVVALLLALAVDAAVRRRPAWLGVWMGLAGATKFVPLLLLPVLIAADASFYRERRRLVTVAGAAAATFTLGLAPMAAAGNGALGELLAYHARRGLHVESFVGTLYGAARAVVGSGEPTTLDFGSFNFHTPVADFLARACTALTLAAIAYITYSLWRGGSIGDDDRTTRIACAAVAGTATLWLTGKVFSPQYLTWGIPLLLAVPGAAGVRLVWIGLGALLLSQIYLRGYYDYVYNQSALGIATLLVRQLALVALVAIAMRLARRPDQRVAARASTRS